MDIQNTGATQQIAGIFFIAFVFDYGIVFLGSLIVDGFVFLGDNAIVSKRIDNNIESSNTAAKKEKPMKNEKIYLLFIVISKIESRGKLLIHYRES